MLCPLVAIAAPAQRPAARKKTPSKPAAKTTAPAPDRWPLASIHVEGNRAFGADAIVRATGLKLGAAVNAADLKRAVDRLTETGAFETISYRYVPEGEQIAVTFQVQEVVDLYPVGFERMDVPDAELLKVLREKAPLFGPQVPATGPMVKRIVEVLRAYRNIEIVGKVLAGPGGKLVMTFRPAEAPPVVTYVKFENSTLIRAEELQRVFYQSAVGVPYTEPRLQELLDSNIRPLFEEKGRLQVRFGPLRVEESKEPTGVVVSVPVEEGDEFHFGKVQIRGNTKFSTADLSRLVKLEEDELANFALVNKTIGDIERRYQREGYMHVKATVERTLDEKKKSVDLMIRIQEGDPYTMRNLVIKGLDINAEAAVRKRWGIPRGQGFDGSYPELFLKRIEEEAMFE
ncbi:MAG: hypothetical protein HY238_15335, partial [Acidobacteria bacterium]|nr:hypothetical protein [Acidobacteriota bacterium]